MSVQGLALPGVAVASFRERGTGRRFSRAMRGGSDGAGNDESKEQRGDK